MEEVSAYIGLGSNLGDRQGHIDQALQLLASTSGINLKAVSTLLETEPVGVMDQPRYLNCVARLGTTLKPWQLLESCQQIERALGRARGVRWGPRTIDLDVLLYGSQVLSDPRLTVPHPEIKNRPFVQSGLQELGAHA